MTGDRNGTGFIPADKIFRQDFQMGEFFHE
jgi:hypothetical protein